VPRAAGPEKAAKHTSRFPGIYEHTCDPVNMRTAYRCQAYPDQARQQLLARTFGCVRLVWNHTLAGRRRLWQTFTVDAADPECGRQRNKNAGR